MSVLELTNIHRSYEKGVPVLQGESTGGITAGSRVCRSPRDAAGSDGPGGGSGKAFGGFQVPTLGT